ncbi:MAG: acyltransferase family protein [Sporolactobacillus sp.]
MINSNNQSQSIREDGDHLQQTIQERMPFDIHPPVNVSSRTKLLKRRYMPGLDGLRALAILAVIAYHLGVPWLGGGLLGVCIFFVLSGYLITDLLNFEFSRNHQIRLSTFWLHRVRRLFPAMLLMISLLYVWIGLFCPQLFGTFQKDALAALFYVSNWWYVFHHLSYFASYAHPSLLTHFWSLAVEEQFYLVWPLLLVISFRFRALQRHLFLITMLAAACSALWMGILYQPGMDPSRVYYGTDTRAFSILIGAALAFLWPSWRLAKHPGRKLILLLNVIGVCALLVLLLTMVRSGEYDPFLYRGGLFLFSMVTALAIASIAHPTTLLSRVLSFTPLVWIGKRSYTMYLWHYPIIFWLTVNTASYSEQFWLHFLAVAILLVISDLSYRFIEKPIQHGGVRKIAGVLLERYRRIAHLKGLLYTIGMTCGLVLMIVSLFAGFSRWADARVAPNPALAAAKEPVRHHTHALPKRTIKRSAQLPQQKKQKRRTAVNRAVPALNSLKISQPADIIGDSLSLDLQPYAQKALPNAAINAAVGRHLPDAVAIVRQLKTSGQLKKLVIIEMGTNGPFSYDQIRQMIQLIGVRRTIILVNTRVPRPWQYTVNQTLARAAAGYQNVRLADWFKISENHGDYFGPDGVHLNQAGAIALTNLLIKTARK